MLRIFPSEVNILSLGKMQHMQYMPIYNKGTYSKLVLTYLWHLTYNMHEDHIQIANLWMKKLEEGKSKVALVVLNYMCYSYWMYWKISLADFPDTDNQKLFSSDLDLSEASI